MNINRYNTAVRKAISAKYVECGKQIQENELRLIELRSKLTRFMDGIEQLTYQEYMDVRSDIEALNTENHTLSIRRTVWNEARELCLDIADEMDDD